MAVVPRILAVDDEATWREIYEELLTPEGYKVVTVADALQELTGPPLSLNQRQAVQRLRGWLIGADGKTCSVVLLLSEDGYKHRHAAKERNIDSRKRDLVESLVGVALGPENESILAEAKSLVQGWRVELEKALRSVPIEVLTESERAAHQAAGRIR